jgi:hypothetical protein
LLEAAIWHRNERLTLSWDPDAWGQARTNRPQNGGGGAVHVDGVDATKLLGEFSGRAPVAYLLVNIESAWYEMFKQVGRASPSGVAPPRRQDGRPAPRRTGHGPDRPPMALMHEAST